MADKKEYIERGALLEMLNNKAKTDYEMGLHNHGALTESFIRFVERQPSADMVEVVRCKDCINNTENGGDCDRVLIHTHRNLVTETNEYLYFRLNYCEYGERKEQT